MHALFGDKCQSRVHHQYVHVVSAERNAVFVRSDT